MNKLKATAVAAGIVTAGLVAMLTIKVDVPHTRSWTSPKNLNNAPIHPVDLREEFSADRRTARRVLGMPWPPTGTVPFQLSRNEIDRLIATLRHQDPRHRIAAAMLLGQAGEPASEAIPSLREMMNDPDKRVSQAAMNALFMIQQLR